MSRLLIVSPWPPPADGIGAHSQMLAGALAERVGVAVAAPGERDGGDVHRVLGLRDGAARAALLRELQPAALYVQFAIAGFGAALPGLEHLLRLARAQGIRTVMVFHEPERDLAALPVVGRAIYRRLAALSDVPVVLAEPARDALVAAGVEAERIVAIPHGVPSLPDATGTDVERVRRRYGLRGQVLLALGFVHADKGADVLAGAAPAVLSPASDVTIAIAGAPRRRRGAFRLFGRADARHLAELREATAWAGDRIRFCGFVPDDDLPALLAAATAMVLPYRRITQSGIAHLCVAGAVPAVASQLPGLQATLGDGALYVPPGDAVALAGALRQVLVDEPGRARQRAALVERRAAWRPAAVADHILELTLGVPPMRAPEPLTPVAVR